MQKYYKICSKIAIKVGITNFSKSLLLIINNLKFFFTNFFWHRTCGINTIVRTFAPKIKKERT